MQFQEITDIATSIHTAKRHLLHLANCKILCTFNPVCYSFIYTVSNRTLSNSNLQTAQPSNHIIKQHFNTLNTQFHLTLVQNLKLQKLLNQWFSKRGPLQTHCSKRIQISIIIIINLISYMFMLFLDSTVKDKDRKE